MSDLLNKEEYSEQDILDILDSKLEESINIEFKNAQALSNTPSVKKEISKDVSSFANSDGGIIFYGINEENHVATSISYVDGNQFSKEWLENVITSSIQQRIDGLKIIPVRFDNDIEKTVYIVKIPKSHNSPHINGDKKYYRRYNFQSVPMEEYEVRDSYLKHRESKVVISNYVVRLLENEGDNKYRFNIEVHILNEGSFMAEKYKIACNINTDENIGISAKHSYTLTNKLQDGYKVSISEIVPLFPNEILNALTFDIQISPFQFQKFLKNTKLEFYVYSLGYLQIEDGFDVMEIMNNLVNVRLKKIF